VTESEFANELVRSKVYNPETKIQLVRIFVIQCQLAMSLTSTLVMVYPLNGVTLPAASSPSRISQICDQINTSKKELSTWMEDANGQLDLSRGDFDALHDSVTLYSDVTYIYYL
jgi:hypothetical protein